MAAVPSSSSAASHSFSVGGAAAQRLRQGNVAADRLRPAGFDKQVARFAFGGGNPAPVNEDSRARIEHQRRDKMDARLILVVLKHENALGGEVVLPFQEHVAVGQIGRNVGRRLPGQRGQIVVDKNGGRGQNGHELRVGSPAFGQPVELPDAQPGQNEHDSHHGHCHPAPAAADQRARRLSHSAYLPPPPAIPGAASASPSLQTASLAAGLRPSPLSIRKTSTPADMKCIMLPGIHMMMPLMR